MRTESSPLTVRPVLIVGLALLTGVILASPSRTRVQGQKRMPCRMPAATEDGLDRCEADPSVPPSDGATVSVMAPAGSEILLVRRYREAVANGGPPADDLMAFLIGLLQRTPPIQGLTEILLNDFELNAEPQTASALGALLRAHRAVRFREALLQLAQSTDPAQRRKSAEWIGSYDDAGAGQAWESLALRDESATVRLAAVANPTDLSPGTLAALHSRESMDPDEAVRRMASLRLASFAESAADRDTER